VILYGNARELNEIEYELGLGFFPIGVLKELRGCWNCV